MKAELPARDLGHNRDHFDYITFRCHQLFLYARISSSIEGLNVWYPLEADSRTGRPKVRPQGWVHAGAARGYQTLRPGQSQNKCKVSANFPVNRSHSRTPGELTITGAYLTVYR